MRSKRDDAAALQVGARRRRWRPLTHIAWPTTAARSATGADETGDIARANNGIRDRLHVSVDSYNGMPAQLPA